MTHSSSQNHPRILFDALATAAGGALDLNSSQVIGPVAEHVTFRHDEPNGPQAGVADPSACFEASWFKRGSTPVGPRPWRT